MGAILKDNLTIWFDVVDEMCRVGKWFVRAVKTERIFWIDLSIMIMCK